MSKNPQLNKNRWEITGEKGNAKEWVTMKVPITENKQSLLILKSEFVNVIVEGKVNSISIDSCKNVNVIFDVAISSVEAVNCLKVGFQVNTSVPCITLDKTHDSKVFLQNPTEGKKSQIVTSACTDINVTVSAAKENEDSVEHPIPYQFISLFDDKGRLITKPAEHVGV